MGAAREAHRAEEHAGLVAVRRRGEPVGRQARLGRVRRRVEREPRHCKSNRNLRPLVASRGRDFDAVNFVSRAKFAREQTSESDKTFPAKLFNEHLIGLKYLRQCGARGTRCTVRRRCC